MPQVNVNGIVLRCYDLGEKDKIVVMLTAERGKLRVVAKGAKRPGGRFAAVASPMTELTASVNLGRNLHTLNQAQILTSHRRLRERLECMALGMFMTELVDHSTVEAEEQAGFLETLSCCLEELEITVNQELLLCYFLIQLLQDAGLSPVIESCACCQDNTPQVVALSIAAGGMICEQCAAKNGAGKYYLSEESVMILRHLSKAGRESYAKIGPVGQEAVVRLSRALEQFAFYQLEARPKSYDFLLSLRAEY